MLFSITTGKHNGNIDIENNDESIISRSIEYYNGKLYADIYCYNEKDDTPLLRELDPLTGKELQTFFNLKEHNKRSHRHFLKSFPFQKNASSFTFFHDFASSVVSIDTNGVTPFISVESNNMFTSKELSQYNLDMPMYDFGINALQIDKFRGVLSCLDFPEEIVLACLRGTSIYSFVYNKREKTTKAITYLTDDILYDDSKVPFQFKYMDTQGAYNVMDFMSFSLFLANLDQLENLTEDSNPVIFYYEYK